MAVNRAAPSFPRAGWEWRRFQAWHLRQLGWKQRDIATALGVSDTAVSRWVACARNSGPGGLRAEPPPGRPRHLTDDDCKKLEALLAEGPVAHGWSNDLWTAARVARVIEKQFGIAYHPGHVSRILKGRLKWTCQRPAQHYKGRDDKAIAQWVAESFPVIAADAAERGRGWSSSTRPGSCSCRRSAAPTRPGARRQSTAPVTRTGGSRGSVQSRSARRGIASACGTRCLPTR